MQKSHFGILSFFLLCSFSLRSAAAPADQPKYGLSVQPLHEAHEFLRTANAPDFWALIPYYIPQQDPRSCSVASVTMLINAARTTRKLTTADELVSQKSLLARVNNPTWTRNVSELGQGVTLDELSKLISQSLTAYGFKAATVEVFRAADRSPKTLAKVRGLLADNEQNAGDFLIANFLQSELTGDPEGAVGHIAPLAAYDKQTKRVLILDPDRQYYEPYWVSDEALVRGLATEDKVSGANRGLVHIRLN